MKIPAAHCYSVPKNFILCNTAAPRLAVIALVTALHLAAYAIFLVQPPRVPMAAEEREMTVMLLASEFSNENLPQPPARIAPPKPAQVNRPQPVPLPVEQQLDAASVPVESAAPDVPATPLAQPTEALPKENAVEKIEPDYQASYLNNRLNYPLSARRMGVQGRVILNVEVLAEGIAGQILIQQSSGHEVLDQAALESVKHWRFIAARRGGEPYTRRFTVPIQFSLQGNAK